MLASIDVSVYQPNQYVAVRWLPASVLVLGYQVALLWGLGCLRLALNRSVVVSSYPRLRHVQLAHYRLREAAALSRTNQLTKYSLHIIDIVEAKGLDGELGRA